LRVDRAQGPGRVVLDVSPNFDPDVFCRAEDEPIVPALREVDEVVHDWRDPGRSGGPGERPLGLLASEVGTPIGPGVKAACARPGMERLGIARTNTRPWSRDTQ
jgi:hypothetical protein